MNEVKVAAQCSKYDIFLDLFYILHYPCKARQRSLESATAVPARPGPPGRPGRPAPAPAEGAAGPGSGSASPDAAGAQRIVTVTTWPISRLNNSTGSNYYALFCNNTWTHFFSSL